MDSSKICCITCANDAVQYAEARLYLENQKLPDGLSMDFRVVEGAPSMTEGYNAAMQSSDAKYKLYIHQDLFLINLEAIKTCIDLFRKNDKIGLIGLAGCVHMPPEGIWWHGDETYGVSAYTAVPEETLVEDYGEVVGEMQRVQVVDGIFMMTQYDLPWREDLFKKWHFYDVAQSMEFYRAGYDVIIPRQETPWSVHESGPKEIGDYHKWRNIFLKEYRREIVGK